MFCYKEVPHDILIGLIKENVKMTEDECIDLCRRKNFNFAGTTTKLSGEVSALKQLLGPILSKL